MHEFLELSNLEKHYSEYPGSIIFAFLAFRNLEQGNPEKALAICEKGVKRHPEYPFGHFVLGLCYYHLKDHSKAKTHLEIATAFDDKNPQAWKLLGEINEHLDLPIQADECNLKYHLLDSFNPDALEKYQKGEIIDFDVFKKENEYDFTPPEKPAAESEPPEKSVAAKEELSEVAKEIAEEKTETAPPIEEAEEEKQPPILIKRDEFMEKMTRDISYEDEDEFPDAFSEDTETAQPQETQETIPEPEDSTEQSTEPDLSDAKSQGSLEMDLDEEIRRGFEDTSQETSESEELLDFRSVVKDIISENDDEGPEVSSEPSSPEAPQTEEGVNEDEIQGEEIEVSKMGRPPILTPTIGEIYIAQGRFKEAIDVFEQLLEKEPDNQRFQKKINDIRVIMEKQNA